MTDDMSTPGILRPVLLVWLAVCVILIIAAFQQISSLSGWGPDDQLRLVQLRDLLAGQGWFDNSQYRLNTPYGSEMHWSRITELPLAIIVLVLTPIMGLQLAEMVAGTTLPLLLLLATGYFLADIARRIGSAASAPIAILLCILTPTILAQFLPMRIDHHGWQIMLASLSLWSLFTPSKRAGGLILGAALALWLHISMEGAPLTAVFFAYLGWRWIFHRAHGERLLWTLLSFGPLSALLFAVANINGFSLVAACDALSFPHLAAIGTATAIMMPAILLRMQGWLYRGLAAILAAIISAGLMYSLAPLCLSDGFAELDPLVRRYWYANVTEGLPIWRQNSWGAVGWVMTSVFGLVAVRQISVQLPKSQREALRIIGWFQVVSLLIALLVMRAAAAACAFAIPVLSIWILQFISQYRASKELFGKVKLALTIMAIVMAGPLTMQVGNGITALTTDASLAPSQASELANEQCQSPESVTSLNALSDARIVAPFDMGPAILLQTPHSVLASSHHRNNAGMRDQIEIFRSPPEKSRQIINARGITHLAICKGEAELRQYEIADPEGLWSQISGGNPPEWLVPMEVFGEGIMVWRVAR